MIQLIKTIIKRSYLKLTIRAFLAGLFLFVFMNLLPAMALTTESPFYHTVLHNESVYSISRKYGVSQEQIIQLNKLQNNTIYEGQKLLIKIETAEEVNGGEDITPDTTLVDIPPADRDGAKQDQLDTENVAGAEDEYRPAERHSAAPATTTVYEGPRHDPFILDVRDADLRDVLSALAIRLDKTVILLDEPARITFYIEGVSPLVAMKLLLQHEGYDYLEEGEIIMVGRPERLQSDFMNYMVLSRFNLQYINVVTMLGALGQFGAEPVTFTVDTNPRTFWAQGSPRELARVRDIVAALDRPENVDIDTVSPLARFNLQYLSADTFEQFITQLGINVQFITMPANPQVFWVQSAPHNLERLQDLIATLDRPENTGFEIKLDMLRFNLSYVPVARMEAFLVEAGINGKDIRTEENMQAIWVYGPPQNLEIAQELIDALDRPENAEQLPSIFVYSLRNISAEYAEERLRAMRDDLNILPTGVQIMNFSFPGISQELLIISPPHLKEQVYKTLGQLDEPRQRIRRPVDSATGPNARNQLMVLRELLSQLTGISISRMYVSGNLSGDSESPYHILWVEETPDRVQQVLDMLVIIESPRS